MLFFVESIYTRNEVRLINNIQYYSRVNMIVFYATADTPCQFHFLSSWENILKKSHALIKIIIFISFVVCVFFWYNDLNIFHAQLISIQMKVPNEYRPRPRHTNWTWTSKWILLKCKLTKRLKMETKRTTQHSKGRNTHFTFYVGHLKCGRKMWFCA